jgi:hypothetical protein
MYLFEESYKTEILKIIASEMKLTSHEYLLPNLELNTNLILLHSSTIPEALQIIMFNHIEDIIKENNLDIRNLLSKESILNNTGYINSEAGKQSNTNISLF